MGSLIRHVQRTAVVPRAQHKAPAEPRQLDLVLDNARLRGMTPAERHAVIRSLALLMLEARGIATQEAGDDNA